MTSETERQRPRVLHYSVHLSGMGHIVRSRAIARAAATRCDVLLVDGGREVPEKPPHSCICRTLPRLYRTPDGLAPVDGAVELSQVLAQRRKLLERLVHEHRPHLVVIEHFPFGRWELIEEIMALIAAAHRQCSETRVVASVRDVLRSNCSKPPYRTIVDVLNTHFSALVVHADPSVTTIQQHIRWHSEIRIPVFYSGYVARRASRGPDPGVGPFVLVSSGGGAGSGSMLARAVEAWKLLSRRGRTGGRVMVLFAGPFIDQSELCELEQACRGGPFLLDRFDPDLLRWLQRADLSISRAGYNTCAELLRAGARCILIPNLAMGDQNFRANRLSEMGIASVVSEQEATPENLASCILSALSRSKPHHEIELDGADRTRALLEKICGSHAGFTTSAAELERRDSIGPGASSD